MQENIESFVNYYGVEHCFEFTITACRLDPEEFSRRMNSCVTNCLREIMPARIGVVEPHKTSHAHQHTLVSLPFTSPKFDHESLKRSREAFNRKDFAASKYHWAKVRASMSPEHSAMWDLLQRELPKYGLGKQIGFAPVRESARAIGLYFGKYLAKAIETRPDSWKRVRLVRYSGTNSQELPPWKNSTPLRSGNSLPDQNRRDKMRVVAREFGASDAEQVKAVLGRHWYFFGRKLIEQVQLPVYKSLLHADADGVPCSVPEGTTFRHVPVPPGDRQSTGFKVVFPDEVWLPWTPPAEARKEGAFTPREVALALLDQAAKYHPAACTRAALLRAFPGPIPLATSARN